MLQKKPGGEPEASGVRDNITHDQMHTTCIREKPKTKSYVVRQATMRIRAWKA